MINLLEGVAIELKIKSHLTLLKNNLNFLLWNWHLKYSNFKVKLYNKFKIIHVLLIFIGLL